jgi:hypothetical protein
MKYLKQCTSPWLRQVPAFYNGGPGSIPSRVGQSGTGTGFSPSTSTSPVSIIPPVLHTQLYLHVALTRKTREWNLGHVKEMESTSTLIFFCEALNHIVFLCFVLYQPNSITYLHFPKIYLASSLPLQEQAHTGNIQSNKYCPPPAINTVPLATSSCFYFSFFLFFNIHSAWWFVKQLTARQKRSCERPSRYATSWLFFVVKQVLGCLQGSRMIQRTSHANLPI